VRTVTRVFEVAGALVQPDVAANLMVLIAEGSGEDDEADRLLRVESVEHLVDLLMAETDDDAAAGLGADPDEEDKHEPMPPVLVQIVAWVLGEYGALVKDTELASVCPLPALVERLCSIGERPSLDPDSRAHVVSALLKLSAQSAAGGGGGGAAVPRRVAALVESFGRSRDLDLCQRCHEFGALVAAGPGLMRAVLPVDASCEDLEEDGKLAFLDNFVALALSNGAPPYSPPDDGDDEDDAPKGGAAGAGSGLKYVGRTPVHQITETLAVVNLPFAFLNLCALNPGTMPTPSPRRAPGPWRVASLESEEQAAAAAAGLGWARYQA